MHKRTILIIILAVLVAGILLRLAYLTADPPTSGQFSPSILGAPGRYASGARGMLLFNQPSVGKDRFFAMSPLMTGLNYLVYKLFGINLTSHRSLPALFSIFCLLVFGLLVYRYMGAVVCLMTAIFLAFNYPLVIYSKAANRLFPMLFFFLVSLWLFLKGVEKQKVILFVTSAFCFFLSFISRGSFLYMVLLFLAIGMVWTREKRMRVFHLLAFFGIFAALMVVWLFLVYMPNREILSAVLADNRQLRAVPGFGKLIYNLFHFPLFSGLRSDLVMPAAGLFSLFILVYRKFKGKVQLPPLLQVSLYWLAIGMLVHLPFSYSPLRFIVDLVFPASLLAAWGLKEWWTSRFSIRKDGHFFLTMLFIGVLTLLLGAIPLLALLPALLKSKLFLLTLLLALTALSFYVLAEWKVKLRGVVLGLILILSMVGNLNHFFLWANQRQYRAVHIVDVLKTAIPPSTICGWFAASLTIGTPHRDTMVWDRGINWQADFLSKTNVDYLLLTGYFPEKSHLQPMFKPELDRAHLVAILNLSQTDFYLMDISNRVHAKDVLEGEAFIREIGTVVCEPHFSQKMALSIETWKYQDVQLHKEFILPDNGSYYFFIHGKGQGRIGVEILDSQRRHQPQEINFKGGPLTGQAVQFRGLSKGNAKIFLKVEPWSRPFVLDRIQFKRVAENPL